MAHFFKDLNSYAMKVREVSCGKMHEFAIALDKAGFNSETIQKIINSENNSMAQKMLLSITDEKFVLFADLGEIIVPEDFKNDKCINMFKKKNFDAFTLDFQNEIYDSDFSKPSYVINPGDKFYVSVFKQIVKRTTSEERLTFLFSKKAVLTGIQGLLLFFDQKRGMLKDKWYTSFDVEERLYKSPTSGYYKMPVLCVDSVNNKKFYLSLQDSSDEWTELDYLVCFVKI